MKKSYSMLELDLVRKVKEIVKYYKRLNPSSTYLNITFIQTEDGKGRISINNSMCDENDLFRNPIHIKEDVVL